MKRAVPAFHVISLSTTFADSPVSFFWKDLAIGYPENAAAMVTLIAFRNTQP
jgi:hypothetical protein